MSRYVCIHGHFYQPPRENPWLEEIELQESAYPYHDWNQRVTAECYAPNVASRILNHDNKIINIINNYSKISFNFGPTLLSWLDKKEPDVYSAILDADILSQQNFTGHGSALAQVYNHMIMPLANSRDKETQIVWGIKDFEYRFKRKPEGMWLAETAVDLETLELMAKHGIRFTILAPNQAKRIRKIGSKSWRDVSGGRVNPKSPYLVNLSSGQKIVIFFYDGPVSQDVAFAGLLNNGENFGNRLAGAFVDQENEPQLVHIATDGESYGHHHRNGEMALSYCLYHIENNGLAELTNYGAYLAENEPVYEAEIFENSSWSCAHGVERWKADCGCNSGCHQGWRQQWRAPLRQAMDWLRDELVKIYELEMSTLVKDPWRARNDYIEVILNRSEENNELFLTRQAGAKLAWQKQVKARQLLEMQRYAMLMFTSCGWFFDDVSGIETVQIILYASRAIQLAQEISGINFESAFVKKLEQASGNLPALANGAEAYKRYVKPEILDLSRVGAHYAISSLFEDYPANVKLFCYWVDKQSFERLEKNNAKLAVGKAHIYSTLTAEELDVCFAVVHLGGEEFFGGVNYCGKNGNFDDMVKRIKEVFLTDGREKVKSLLDDYFIHNNYSLRHLFCDEQRKILSLVAKPAFEEIKESLRLIFEKHYQTIRGMNKLRIHLPMALYTTAKFVINNELRQLLEADEFNHARFQKVVEEFKDWPIKLDRKTIIYHASLVINRLVEKCFAFPENINWLKQVNLTLQVFLGPPLGLNLNLWRAQNLYFKIGQKLYAVMSNKEAKGSEDASRWRQEFDRLGEYLKVRVR
ncbi:glycoside hydrolase [Candidatus Falkowbacteria bacterium RIFCSPLOWO2_12_FULL_45_13]|uniref:Glycoside hydrolase n=2 Tax=Bacteria TaxID=2 RepID=A0A1F4RAV8_UNCSA|nr:MAG: glycoside hydrolase [candidate division WOR-1 bacterium RIFCSPHIGHO2_02_FULL_45_12]OGC05304.1 MAG: glycoside hydrolase [candidate division WOR-1 bacterium RIFCSPLOWO2_02_FULL_46_20]OGF32113.1 MAG: glycoside hydrolase [Candidatus Falkowbacteria bacterium RIFCSPLOWO2_12_FULL_45_13]